MTSIVSRLYGNVKGVWSFSIRRQLMLGIALVHAVLMTIFVVDLVERQREFLHRQSIDQALSLAETLAASSASWVLADDVIGLEEVIQAQLKYPGLHYAMVHSETGRVLGHTNTAITGLYVADIVSRGLFDTKVNPRILVDNGALVDVAAPVLANERLIGWARVALGQEANAASLQVVTRDGVLYTLLAIGVGTVFAFFMAKGLTLGLKRLLELADRVRQGDRHIHVSLNRKDELGQLGDNLNQMVIAVTRAEMELRKAREELEHRVQERTKEISQANASLSKEKERALVTLHSIGDAVITTDAQGVVEFLNPVAESLTGWPVSMARGHPLGLVYNIIDEQSRETAPDPVAQCLDQGHVINVDTHNILINRNGQEYGIQETAAPIRSRDGDVLGVVLVFKDISEARRMAQQIAHQATHDDLTGLVNRAEFEKRLKRVLETARNENAQHAMCYLDLDQFKIINDTCGHVAGDELLRQLGNLLQAQIRACDTLARLGGDEFGVLMEHCPLDQAQRVAEQLRKGIDEFRFLWEGKSFNLGVSIGLVSIITTSESATSVLRAADAACYRAKDQGRNRINIYREDDAELAKRHGEIRWAARIPRALENDCFQLDFQPIVQVNAGGGEKEHYELLLRLQDKRGYLVPPGAFFPAAERYNLATKIDCWVIEKALRWLACHPAHLERLHLCAINLSGQSLDNEGFLKFVHRCFDKTGVPPEKICFEITETAAIANLTKASHFITTLEGWGCRFALDDFGSGLSSFAYFRPPKTARKPPILLDNIGLFCSCAAKLYIEESRG
ncbi:MAG: diguanylate cyclase [Gammaproteobacteria bacterium]|nr:diguanylate cyclase [Gammaproteobacteria bacterium]